MTNEDIALVRESFAEVMPIRDQAGALFYQRLFALAPETRSLFKGDVTVQAGKLMDTLAVAVRALSDTPALATMLRDLGRRHRGYGVTPAHYQKVGEALLSTLEAGLGPKFTAETRAAWVSLYGFVAREMNAA